MMTFYFYLVYFLYSIFSTPISFSLCFQFSHLFVVAVLSQAFIKRSRKSLYTYPYK